MPRNGSGTYILSSGNPVAAGTIIDVNWANPTLTDIASALTTSLATDGQSVMSGQLKLANGVVTAPGLTFNSEASTGLFRASTNNIAFAVGGVEAYRLVGTNFLIGSSSDTGQKLQVTGTTQLTGAVAVIGNTNLTGTLTTSDALTVSANGANITGNSTVAGTLNVNGNVAISGSIGLTGAMVASGSLTSPAFIASSGGTPVAASITKIAANGFQVQGAAGSLYDFSLVNPTNTSSIMTVPTGTVNVNFAGNISVSGTTQLTGAVTTSTTITAGGAITAPSFVSSSTKTLKKNIKNMDVSYAIKLKKLKPREFDWNEKSLKFGNHDFGFIAEEMIKVFPEIVGKDMDGKLTGIDYAKLTTILVAKVNELEARLATVEGE